MDKPRIVKPPIYRRAFALAVGLVLIALVTLGLASLSSAPPAVERSSVWIDTVRRGPVVKLHS